MRSILILIILTIAIIQVKTVSAQNTNEILLRLRQNDNQVIQGFIEYDKNPHNYRVISNIPPPPSISYRQWVIYSKTGRYKSITKNANNPRFVTEIGGGAGNNLIADPTSIMAMKTLPAFSILGGKNTFPSVPLGRGLTNLQNLAIVRKGGAVMAVGRYGEGINIQAILDPKHGYLADEMLGYNQEGKRVLDWKMRGWKKSMDGVWIPQYSTLYLYANLKNGSNPLRYKGTFHILQASFQPPPSSAFDLSVKGRTVYDDRYGIPVTDQEEFPGEALNKILQRTGPFARQLAQMREAEERAKSVRRLIEALTAGLFVCTLIAFAWIMRRKKMAS